MKLFTRAMRSYVSKTCINRQSCAMQDKCYYKNNLYNSDISIDSRHPKCFMLVDILKWYAVAAPLAIFAICFGVYSVWSATVKPIVIEESTEIIENEDDLILHRAIINEDIFSVQFSSKILEERYTQIPEIAFVPRITRTYIETPILYKQRNTYTEEEILALEKIVQAESGGEPYLGQLCVANVVLNRQEKFGGTIEDIIFAGNQFSPIRDGSYETAEPSESAKRAVRAALNGHDNSNGCLYFMNESIATSKWASDNRKFSHIIANHSFFK